MEQFNLLAIVGIVVSLFHLLGALSVVHAIMTVRTSQGTIAWIIFLLTFPYIGLPVYWIFGRNKFIGEVAARRSDDKEISHIAKKLTSGLQNGPACECNLEDGLTVMEKLVHMPVTCCNNTELLVDGVETFKSMFNSIDRAKKYILIQFFIVKNDTLGKKLKKKLEKKATEGVRVHFLYDEVGSYKLPDTYTNSLTKAGVKIFSFNTTKGWRNKFQLNFRNHRKVIVVDGHTAFVGGVNIGDEYKGRGRKFDHWRDTNIIINGPAVLYIQISFLEDWYWATHDIPKLCWNPVINEKHSQNLLVMPTGPADNLETCSLLFVHAIHSATKRVWITSPYFVPDQQVMAALQIAALKGVDVRILLPQKPDHLLVYLSSFAFCNEIKHSGVKIYRYQPGFMHQKVMLIDDDNASVGSANLDNRSFRLNFEINILVNNNAFAKKVKNMLESDFKNSKLTDPEEFEKRSIFFKLAVRFAHLLAPIQ